MSVIRVHKNKNFTVMSNVHLRDMDLSLKAKGLLSVMLSLPDNWNYSIAGLCSICKENETAIKSTIKELKERRYVIVDKKYPNQTESKKYEYVYHIFEEPQPENQEVEKQGVENLPLDNLPVENHPLNKRTDISSTDISSKDKTNTDGLNTKKAETLSNDNDEADTISLKKSLPTSAKKKTKSELMELEVDMCRRFIKIGSQYDVTDTALKNIVNAFARYSSKYTERTGKIHPILKDETLEKIFVTLATISDTEYGHFENVADYEPDSDGLSYLDKMVDEHFKSEHGGSTDWHISHFARPDYLEKMAQHIVEW